MNKTEITKRLKPGCKLYVYLEDTETALKFAEDAENQGFLFGDGKKPTERTMEMIMAVNEDKTINYVGFTGFTVYGCKAKKIGEKTLIRVDYKKHLQKANKKN